MPAWVTPDGLTSIGFAGAVTVCAGYWLSNSSIQFLWLAVAGFGLHWFGDSLDGSLARFRGIERPRYGYFLDHSVDALGNTIIAIGLGLTPFVRMDVALFALVGYLLLSIFVFLKRQVLDEIQLSFLALGPTEIRVALVAITATMPFAGKTGVFRNGTFFSICDLLLVSAGILFILIFSWNVRKTARRLRAEENSSGA
jgi:phosphatidylglycerophosphate synthase